MAKHLYISIMLRKLITKKKWLYLIKIDPVKEFPGNNPFLYFYLFDILV